MGKRRSRSDIPVSKTLSREEIRELISEGSEFANLRERQRHLTNKRGWMVRFFSYLDCSDGVVDQCWNWTGALRHSGHGEFSIASWHVLYPHRLAYALFKGPITAGLDVCHTCDNPRCCNPDHLWLGTRAENTLDAHKKGRLRSTPPPAHLRARGEASGRARLTLRDVKEILGSNETAAALGRKFGVSPTTVSAIRVGTNWRHVERPAISG